jgi:O-antigen/teichoic acid export membrane protein
VGYVRSALTGFGWMGGFRVVTRAFSIVRTIILARILSPSQFGVYGIVLIVLAVLELLTETGINIFLIQEDEDSIDGYINTAWVVSIIRGVLICILLLLSAPHIGRFFNALDVIPLLYLAGLVPLIRGFINPSQVKLQKNLQFGKEFGLRTSVFIFDCTIAIIAAFVIKSPSALILGLIAGAILEVILSFIVVSPSPKFKFEKEKSLHVVKTGKWITLAGIFDYLAKNGDNLVVGKILGTASLGYYQMAYTFSTLPVTEISDVSGKVVFPIYSRIAGDKNRLKRAYLMLILVVTAIASLMSAVFFLFAKPITLLVLGENWLPIVEPLKILSIFGALKAISGTSSALFLGLRKQHLVTIITFVRFVTLAVVVVPLTNLMGIYGTSLAALISSIVALPFIVYFITRVLVSPGRADESYI